MPELATASLDPDRRRRVVITGRGAITPLGDCPNEIHRALCEGRRGAAGIRGFDTGELPIHEAAEVDFDPTRYFQGRNLRPIDRTGRLVIAAAQLTLDDAGWDEEALAAREAGLVLGTMFGSIHTISAFDRRALEAGPKYVKPFDFANSVINAAAGQTAIWHGLRGINSTITGGIGAGLQALGYATDLIRGGRAEALLAGGGDELCFESALGFSRAGHLAHRAASSVPFSAGREGMTMGEGAALLMLEAAETASARDAKILAEVRGHGSTFDPSRGHEPERAAAAMARAIRQALTDAGCTAQQIAWISAGANGSPAGDLREARALASIFSEAMLPPVTAIKSALGEGLGASAALQALQAIEASRRNEWPGISGLEQVDPELPLSGLGANPKRFDEQESRLGLVTSTGLDGQSSAMVLEVFCQNEEASR